MLPFHVESRHRFIASLRTRPTRSTTCSRSGFETGKVARLTNDPAAEEHAIQFSPDDEWLTVGTNKRLPEAPDRPGQLNIWKVRADGSDYTPLTRHAFPVFGGLWSDDGTWISYVPTRTDEHQPGTARGPAGGTGRRSLQHPFRVAGSLGTGIPRPDACATSVLPTESRRIVDVEERRGRSAGTRRIGSRSTRFAFQGAATISYIRKRGLAGPADPLRRRHRQSSTPQSARRFGLARSSRDDTKLLITTRRTSRFGARSPTLSRPTQRTLVEPEYVRPPSVFVNAEQRLVQDLAERCSRTSLPAAPTRAR